MPAESTSKPWTDHQKDECIHRGCHYSATEHSTFLREEMADFIENRFWMVLPYELIRHLEELMMSPAAVKEERERKPRLLCDHSWDWGWPSVNESTVAHAPPEAMQFGGALPRVLRHVRHANPKFGPVRAAKHDLKDGFYHLFLRALDCLRLCVLLPRYGDEPQLIGIPMACTMGWVQSPPTFCTMSETVCDLANQSFADSPRHVEPHRLEPQAAEQDDLSPSMEPRPKEPEAQRADDLLAVVAGAGITGPPDRPAPPSNCPYTKPLGHTDVFMDDFIQLGQGGPARMKALRQHLLHAIDQVLARPEVSPDQRLEAVSLKKLLKGDGSWGTRKVILGWIVDTVRQTIELPAHRKETLANIFQGLQGAKRVGHKRWQRILGKLRFVAQAIPGSAGLFSALQLALNRSDGNRVRVTKALRSHISAFARLAASLSNRPTHLAEIVPQEPTLLGATDAAKAGMGGVYFDADGQAFVWRHPFEEAIQDRLVSAANPAGTVTNSDLEHAGVIGQLSVQAENTDVEYATVRTGIDNTPAVSRVQKGAVSSEGPAAALCNIACMHQRLHRYCHQAGYLPGDANVMADDASRLQHLTDSAFLAHFEQHYPQERAWVLLRLPSKMASSLTSALLLDTPAEPILPRIERPNAPTSGGGPSSVNSSECPLPSVLSRKKNGLATSSSSASATESSAPPTTLSELTQWIKPFWPWARASPTWTSRIPERKVNTPETSIPYSLISSVPCDEKTILRPEPTLSMSPSCAPSRMPLISNIPETESSTSTSLTSSLSPSSGCYDRRSTPTPRRPKLALKPSSFATSTSPSTTPSTAPPRLL